MSKLDKDDFIEAVYQMVRYIPYGRATSYGAVARAIGYPNMSRLVGKVLSQTSGPSLEIPAHRVVNSQGVLSGKDAFETSTAMQERLEAEGVKVVDNRIKNWKSVFWNPIEEVEDVR
jgi:methylated-DNA-protein-cysteine methyltransferase related protein